MAYPERIKRIPVPEVGEGAYIEMLNPWLLPKPEPLPVHLRGDKAEPEVVEQFIESRSRETMTKLIRGWSGITDYDGAPLPLPSEDSSVFDRLPRVVEFKLNQAIDALEADHEWDPTKRPAKDAKTPPTETSPPEPSAN